MNYDEEARVQKHVLSAMEALSRADLPELGAQLRAARDILAANVDIFIPIVHVSIEDMLWNIDIYEEHPGWQQARKLAEPHLHAVAEDVADELAVWYSDIVAGIMRERGIEDEIKQALGIEEEEEEEDDE